MLVVKKSGYKNSKKKENPPPSPPSQFPLSFFNKLEWMWLIISTARSSRKIEEKERL
jgi:hypothetical protein